MRVIFDEFFSNSNKYPRKREHFFKHLAKIKTNSLPNIYQSQFLRPASYEIKGPLSRCPHPLQWEAQIRYLLHAYAILFAGFLVWITKEKLLRELERSVYGSAKDSLGHSVVT
jgi:hypothetical protein